LAVGWDTYSMSDKIVFSILHKKMIMKRKVLVLFLLCCGFVGFAQKETVHKIKGKIDLITVFLQGAEINVNLQTGRNLLIIEGLSPQINTSSIRLSTGDETISVLAISTESNYNVHFYILC